MTDEIARYKVLRTSYLHKRIYEEGEEVEFDGKPGSALEPLNDAARTAKGTTLLIADSSNGDIADGNGDIDSNQGDVDLTALREQYEGLFNKKPGNMSAETLQAKIAEERTRMGV